MTNEALFAATTLASWKLVIGRFSKVLAALPDEKLEKQVAPSRNRLFYLVGHLTAVHDRMFPMFGLGPRLYPHLDDAYITNPDKTLPDPISPQELRAAFEDVNQKLTAAFASWTPAEWLEKHASVSTEDFALDPTRNRLAVVLSRTSHAAFHSGQAILAN